MTHYVTYVGLGTHYVVLITKLQTPLTPKPEIEAALKIGKDEIVAVDDYTFQLLIDGSHISPKKLLEVPEPED